ncbi:COX8 domain-containing protein [Rhincodon typus]|uniref:COX8 domain-containing protein n=1 Tax=Rhincodon typus TaxID=259920 RepID=UPI0009A3A35C|nr:COX8 domain-containing protein [Rhincodon typus]
MSEHLDGRCGLLLPPSSQNPGLGSDCEKLGRSQADTTKRAGKIMSGFLRGGFGAGGSGRSLLRTGKQLFLMQRANIYGKPPKEKIGPVASVFCLSVFALTLLGPAGWILHHLQECRKKD